MLFKDVKESANLLKQNFIHNKTRKTCLTLKM